MSENRTKVRMAAAQAVTRLTGLSGHFFKACAMADNDDVEGARRAMAPLKDDLLAIIDALTFAGVSGLTEKE